MKIIETRSLPIPDLKVIRFARFRDERGYFSEPFRKSGFLNCPEISVMQGNEIVQTNESLSKKGTIRGLHFQWNPYMGKLVRTLKGRMVDLALDIRKGSPTFGKMMTYAMPHDLAEDCNEWIWVPPGFAHGNLFTEETIIEYFCTGEYSPSCEAGISPLAKDIDWSLCSPEHKEEFETTVKEGALMTEKDRLAPSITDWKNDERSENFIYDRLKEAVRG